MTPEEYISQQAPERQQLLSSLHKIILKTNKKVTVEVAPMMRAEMIQYKIIPKVMTKPSSHYFVYGLASVKSHISLHLMPMYAHKPIHEKYSKLLKKAKFQKGCINFKNETEMPLDIAEQLMADCAKIDWMEVLKKYGK
jgi:Domain of unknown function (DU1801)